MIEMIICILWIIGSDMAMFLSTEKWGMKCFQLIKTAFLSWIYVIYFTMRYGFFDDKETRREIDIKYGNLTI